MGIRAKMYVTKKEQDPNSSGQFILGFQPVTSGSQENESFFKFTPAGSLSLQTVNEAVASQLEVGQEAYIDITPIPKPGQPVPESDVSEPGSDHPTPET